MMMNWAESFYQGWAPPKKPYKKSEQDGCYCDRCNREHKFISGKIIKKLKSFGGVRKPALFAK